MTNRKSISGGGGGGLNIIHFKNFEKIHNLKNITNFQFARQISSYEVKVTHGVGEPEVAIASKIIRILTRRHE